MSIEVRSALRVALVLTVVQLLATLGWTVYAAVLPSLLASTGLPATARPWILLADMVIFALCDLLAGAWLDRAERTMRRIGGAVLGAMSLATLAFVALPHLRGASAGPWLLGVIAVWVIASGALRAPLPRLLARHTSLPTRPLLAAFLATGTGLAGVLLPPTLDLLRRLGPAATFALSGVTLWLSTVALVVVGGAPVTPPAPTLATLRSLPATVRVVAATGLSALAMQAVTALAMTGLLRRFVTASEAVEGAAIFGLGLALSVLAGAGVKALGAVRVLRVASVLGALAALGAGRAPSLLALVLALGAAGFAWGVSLTASLTALTERAPETQGSRWTGAWFAVQAAATGVRMGAAMILGALAPGVVCLAAAGLWAASALVWPAEGPRAASVE